MSLNVLIKEKKDGNDLVEWRILRILMSSINNRKISGNMFQTRPYGKAELEAMHYNPKRRTFLKPEVEAIVRHLGKP